MQYVDGFLMAVLKKNLKAYAAISRKAGKIWREYGAMDYRECVGDDLFPKSALPFAKIMRLKKGEAVVFSWILYKSRADRKRINAAVMKDPRLASMMDPKNMPFDMKRMSYAGFKTLVKV